ncbi:MAG: hypothetical protein WBC18_28220 [Ottowia sp.]|uniref:hypothetical protein n=1 Tax=unclassified Ottowia TaxID=2645081 RepID=UPI003C2D0EBF
MKRLRLLPSLLMLALLSACAVGPSLDERIAAQRAGDVEAARALAAEAPSGDDLPQWLEAQRARITAGRAAAAQRFADQEKLCWKRFTVNACIREASDQRRATLDRLRQEELTLNDLERKRRTAGRLQDLDQKQRGKE